MKEINPKSIKGAIAMVKTEYSRTASGKSWRSKPDEKETRVITAVEYANCVNSIPFFRNLTRGTCGSERVENGYTANGYIPTKITSVSPDGDIKIIRKFYFEDSVERLSEIYGLDV